MFARVPKLKHRVTKLSTNQKAQLSYYSNAPLVMRILPYTAVIPLYVLTLETLCIYEELNRVPKINQSERLNRQKSETFGHRRFI